MSMDKDHANLDLDAVRKLYLAIEEGKIFIDGIDPKTRNRISLDNYNLALALRAAESLMKMAVYLQENANSGWADDEVTKYLGREHSRKNKAAAALENKIR